MLEDYRNILLLASNRDNDGIWQPLYDVFMTEYKIKGTRDLENKLRAGGFDRETAFIWLKIALFLGKKPYGRFGGNNWIFDLTLNRFLGSWKFAFYYIRKVLNSGDLYNWLRDRIGDEELFSEVGDKELILKDIFKDKYIVFLSKGIELDESEGWRLLGDMHLNNIYLYCEEPKKGLPKL